MGASPSVVDRDDVKGASDGDDGPEIENAGEGGGVELKEDFNQMVGAAGEGVRGGGGL